MPTMAPMDGTAGPVPRTVRIPGFVLTLGVHPARTELPRHTHDDPTLCYVARGRFTEYSRGLASLSEVALLAGRGY
ncbi:MAG TPA: hypothetical protein VMM18_17350 [Gemmatimonadaceae bacterium]|nr:hypothetical protein [Gemmatimonadaceae bacterium]